MNTISNMNWHGLGRALGFFAVGLLVKRQFAVNKT